MTTLSRGPAARLVPPLCAPGCVEAAGTGRMPLEAPLRGGFAIVTRGVELAIEGVR